MTLAFNSDHMRDPILNTALGAILMLGLGFLGPTRADDEKPAAAGASESVPAPESPPSEPERIGFTEKPRWEFGIGGGFLQSFDYPASADPNVRAIALPFLIYRTNVVRVGDGGMRAVAVERPTFKLDISIGGGLASSSESDGVRAGLPDLDFLVQVGPRAQWLFLNQDTTDGGQWQGSVTAALRGVVSTDFGSAEGQGLVFDLAFSVARRRVFGSKFDALARVASTWSEDRLQEYFYSVAPEFETADRPAFDAGSGYLATRVFLGGAYRPTKTLRLFAGVQIGLFDGAANQDSPLFETTSSAGVALGFSWTIRTSKDNVSIVDVES